MSLSTIAPVLAALKTRWISDLAVSSPATQVIYGPRIGKVTTRSSILTIGDVEFTRTPVVFAQAGDQFAEDEPWSVNCVAEVFIAGATDQQPATEAALALFTAALTSLQPASGDETLGVARVQWVRITGTAGVVAGKEAATIKAGRSASVPFKVQVQGVL